MTPLTLAQVRTILHAQPGNLPDRTVARVTTDTRDVREGDLFVALRGERFDPHDFVNKAANATAAVVERVPKEAPPDLTLFLVDDTRKALGALARHHRQSLRHTQVVAVAGSNGKTGTKHLVHAALSGHLKGTVSPKSFNNDIGVPLTLLPVEPQDDYVVIECGTNHPGEIEVLSRIAEPDMAVITSIGEEHLEGLGDLAGVRQENARITAGMKSAGTLILPGDDRPLVAICNGYAGRKVTFGLDSRNDLFATDVRTGFDGTRFGLNGSRTEVFVPAMGLHTATNTLAALAVARRLGVPEDVALAGLAKATGPAMRLEKLEANGVTILNDAYNANPASMAAALATLRALPHAGRKLAVLGDMLELGPAGDDYHRAAGRQAAEAGVDLLVCVGMGGSLMAAGAVRAGLSSTHVHAFADAKAAAHAVTEMARPGDLVLLKASRGIGLERVAEALTSAAGAGSRLAP